MSLIITDRSGGTHSLPTEWLVKRLYGWMTVESQGGPWWLCVLSREGQFLYATQDGTAAHGLDEERTQYARQVCRRLNQTAHHGGAWVVAWFDRGARFYLCFKDCDGDIHIPIECDLGWERIRTWTPEDWAEQAEQAWAMWDDFQRDMGIDPRQQIRLAQGEKPRSLQ